MAVRRNAIGQKTYWHLLEARRVPSRYEIATSRLLWRPSVGVATRTPVTAWSEAHPGGLRGSAEAWEAFVDPAQLTYGAYVQQRAERESHVDQLPIDDAALAPAWIDALGAALGPLRFPRHGLMMAVSFAGSMAPSGRITVACAFHAGDAIRHVERFADRLVQLRAIAPGCGDDARARWLDAPAWQPLRRLVEHLLVTYDWAESLVALAAVVEPLLDRATRDLAARARAAGDPTTHHLLCSLDDDAAWHRAWFDAFVATARAADAENGATIERWIDTWQRRAAEVAPVLEEALA